MKKTQLTSSPCKHLELEILLTQLISLFNCQLRSGRAKSALQLKKVQKQLAATVQAGELEADDHLCSNRLPHQFDAVERKRPQFSLPTRRKNSRVSAQSVSERRLGQNFRVSAQSVSDKENRKGCGQGTVSNSNGTNKVSTGDEADSGSTRIRLRASRGPALLDTGSRAGTVRHNDMRAPFFQRLL